MTTNITTISCPYNHLVEKIAIFKPKGKKEWLAFSASCAALVISSGAAVAAGACYLGYKWGAAKKFSDPNTVEEIYTPPHPSKADLSKIYLYAEKIDKLKKNPWAMGIAFAPNETGILTPIYITRRHPFFHTTRFEAYDLATDELLGYAITRPLLESNQYLKEGYWSPRPKNYEGYGSSKEEVSKVLLDVLKNASKYKNIGVILNKAIHQHFEKECQARMIIEAYEKSHPYHYKIGFRSADPDKNDLYAWYAKRDRIPGKDLEFTPMYLPDRARELWLNEIHNHPIGFPAYSFRVPDPFQSILRPNEEPQLIE